MQKRFLILQIVLCVLLFGCIEERVYNGLYNSNLAAADCWSYTPEILSGGVGFADIVGLDAEDITRENALNAGAAWLDDSNCDPANTNRFTTTSIISGVELTYVGQVDYSQLKDGATAMDGQPIVFSWPVLSENVHPEDFQLTLNTGEVIFPMYAGIWPNAEYNERNCIVLFGELCNRLPSSDPASRYPVAVEIVDDGTPLMLIGPDQQIVSAVGLTFFPEGSPYDPNNGPRLCGAKLNYCGNAAKGEGIGGSLIEGEVIPNDEFTLFGGGDYRLRVLTTGGFSPDGVRSIYPTDFEKFFRIHVKGPNGTTIIIDQDNKDFEVLGGHLRVIGMSDLGPAQGQYDECYLDDKDNYIDIILNGDDEAARNITFIEIPSIAGGYNAFYNPGGPGTTPTSGVNYTQPGPPDLEPVLIALDDPLRVSYDAYRYR